MKRQILTLVGMAYFGLPVLAAADFSGSWVRDSAQSDPVQNFMYWLTREPNSGGAGGGGGRGGGRGQGGPGGRGMGGPAPMVVEQSAGMLQVTDPQSGAIRKYKLDSQPFTVAMDTGLQKATVAASIEGDTLVIRTTEPYGGMPGNVTLEVKDVWTLSPDGKVLTIATTRTAPAVEKSFKEVYNRQ